MDRTRSKTELRRRAEAQIALGALPAKSELDPARVLHELQVHRIELELQNEELISANRDLEVLRAKYKSFYDEAPVAYLTLSTTGDIVEFNACAAQMLKRERKAVVGLPMRAMFAPESEPDFVALLQKTEGGELAASDEHLLINRPSAVPMFVKAHARRHFASDAADDLVLLIMMDMTALKFATDDVLSTIRDQGNES